MNEKTDGYKLSCWLCGLLAMCLMALAGCGNREQVLQLATTDHFAQDLNPPFLDILWMVSDRTDMQNAVTKLLPQAEAFFKRLDGATSSYRLAFASADMEVNPGKLRPLSSPFILEKSLSGEGLSVDERLNYFRYVFANTINLSTGATERGLESALTILGGGVFTPRDNVPLVIVLVSDAEDRSLVPGGGDAIDYYEQKFLALKKNNRKLLRVYSVNYTDKITDIAQRTTDTRCATRYAADIDNMAGYVGRYFEFAKRFSADLVDPAQATGDLCQAFANNIDISGLRQKELPKRFLLKNRPSLSTLQVSVFRPGTGETYDIPWKYDETTNEVVFETAPPEGANLSITYYPG